jgi:xanthine dehydrogenase large subunit
MWKTASTVPRQRASRRLLLPFSVFFAIRDAISSVGGHKVNPPLNAPATSEEILRAISAVEAAS